MSASVNNKTAPAADDVNIKSVEMAEMGGHMVSATSPVKQGEWKKYSSYSIPVDPNQADRATTIKLFSIQRPHMRSFHLAWFSFFWAFVTWFAFAPLIEIVKDDLKLGEDEVYDANIASVSGTIIARLLAGPMCDAFGGRKVSALLLGIPSIPALFAGLVNSATGLAVIRFFIGFMGAVFVGTQAWSSQIFAKEVVGSANAITAGWGNLGGGATNLIMIGCWEMFQAFGLKPKSAWRASMVVPAVFSIGVAFLTWFCADDCPKGQFDDLVKHGAIVRKSSAKSMRQGAKHWNAWVMAMQYACSFGIELTMFNVMASYLKTEFDLTFSRSALIASLFGLMNLFSRATGGIMSDWMYQKFGAGSSGMRGRILLQFTLMFCEGISILLFIRQKELGKAVAVLIFFSFFATSCNGSCFSIVPYICPTATGSVSGIVGAGGNLGAVLFGLVFRFGPVAKHDCMLILGWCVLATSFTTVLIQIQGYSSCFRKAKGEPASIAVL